MKNAAISDLVNHFQKKDIISREELYTYFRNREGELKQSTFGWRIYELKKNNIITEAGRGLYNFNVKPVYLPIVNDTLIKIAELFTTSYSAGNYCVWDVNWINEFTIHQFNKEEYILETEKDLQESVAYTLSDNGFRNIIWNVKGTHVTFINSDNPIIILPIVSRSPVQQIQLKNGIILTVPTLEKMLVDMFENTRVFHYVQGAEMERIFRNAIDRYSFNSTTFFAYAKRRGKYIQLRELLLKLFPDKLKTIE